MSSTDGKRMNHDDDRARRLLTVDEMKQAYGDFCDKGLIVQLDRQRVPRQFWPLLPYAEFWGIADDLLREP